MKIVTCITRLIRGGAQRVALETAARLTALGHDAPIWCGPETGPEGSLHEEAAARGVRVRLFPRLCRAVSPWADLRVIDDLARALREERPDWLHTHSSKAGIVGREAAARAMLPRVAHTVHGWGFTPQTPRLKRRIFISLERREARRGQVIFVQPADQEEGVRLGIVPPGIGRIIPPGIDLAGSLDEAERSRRRLEMRSRLGLAPDLIVGGFLGRLAPQKDPAMVLSVAAALVGEHPEVHWIVAGDGPLDAELRRRAQSQPELAPRVHWGGLVDDPATWLSAMDFLLLPSRWEGAPLTVMEAMAAGLPLVASDLPGIRWLLAGAPLPGGADETFPIPDVASVAHLVPIGSVSRFVEGTRAWIRDPARRAEAGRQARAIALARFGLDRMFERLLRLYLNDPVA